MEGVEFTVEENGDDELLVTLRVPGSKFGAVEVVLDHEAAEQLSDSLAQALVFAGATGGDSDG
jgi:hypothetical protein